MPGSVSSGANRGPANPRLTSVHWYAYSCLKSWVTASLSGAAPATPDPGASVIVTHSHLQLTVLVTIVSLIELCQVKFRRAAGALLVR